RRERTEHGGVAPGGAVHGQAAVRRAVAGPGSLPRFSGMLAIRLERAGDAGSIRAVQLAAFGQPDEADLVDALRDGGDAVLSVVAEENERIVSHVLFSRLRIHAGDDAVVPALALAPMAVAPERQRQGIGSALLTEALGECRARSERLVIVVGHVGFY